MASRLLIASAALLLATPVALAQKTEEAAAKKPALVPGSPAPALSIEKWVKGAPIASFEKGKIYVVEFWATWCGPCVASMPHISALQRQYKDKGVTIIGVTAEDPDNSLADVEAMVKDKGDGMDYTVAWDKGNATKTAFMTAAEQKGIPCSFLIDGTGKVAFIGHPTHLDLPLKQVVAGTWDIEKGNAAIAEASKQTKEIMVLARMDPKAALAKMAEFEKKYPDFVVPLETTKFNALMAVGDFVGASALGGKLVDAAIAAKDAQKLNAIAWSIVDPEVKLEKRDLDLAQRAAEKAVDLTHWKDGAIIDTLARVYFWKGDLKKAIELQTKAIDASSPEMKQQLQGALDEYKAKDSQ